MEKKQTKKDLEDKISQLEDKLTRLSDQLESKPKSKSLTQRMIENHRHFLDTEKASETYGDTVRMAKLEKYEQDYLNRIDNEKYSFSKPSVTLPKGFNYVEPELPRTRSGGTLPKGFGRTGKLKTIDELDDLKYGELSTRYRQGQTDSSKSKTLSKRNRLLMSVPITAALITIVGVISQSEIVSIIMIGSSPIPFTLIAIGLKIFKTKQKDMSNGVNVKASFLQSIMIMLGMAKIHKVEQTPEPTPDYKRGTLPKGF